MKLLKYIFLLVLAAAVLTQCKKDDDDPCCDPTNPECPNYDPCLGKIETTSDFAILQPYAQVGPNAGTYFEDSVTFGATMRFVAKDTTADSYRWILGVDTIYNEIEVTRSSFSLPEGSYPVTLKVTKDPDSLCFPLDDGMDEKTKFFTKINGCDAAIWGEYRGVLKSNVNDSLIIILLVSPSPNTIQPCNPQSPVGYAFGLNLLGQNDTIRLEGNGRTNTRYSFHLENSTSDNTGEAILDLGTGRIEISYSLDGDSEKFHGIKL